MGFYQTESAVAQESRGTVQSCVVSKEDVPFHLRLLCIVWDVNRILDGILTEQSSDRLRVFWLSENRIFRPRHSFDLGNGIFSNNFKADHDVWAHESLNFLKVRLLGVLVEQFTHKFSIQFEHLSFVYFESLGLANQVINDLSYVDVRVRLYHNESSLGVLEQVFFGEFVGKLHYFESSSINVKGVSHE